MVALKTEDIPTAEAEDVILRKVVYLVRTAVFATRLAREGRPSGRIAVVRVRHVSICQVDRIREDA